MTLETLEVKLADAPTDVLVRLVDHGRASVDELCKLAPSGSVDVKSTVHNALGLLLEMGYVSLLSTGEWYALGAGHLAVAEARQVGGSDGD